ncbi:hypothetical protein [Lentilactobacillus kefiri]|uniref:Uncharacterized protein n=3 Tax=Lentilactobacillus kefiri TaxID=33962 RepID=A0A8E1V1W3_LENKE|nr:hypothetical protein [Lentilactobacillus kefiri]KRL70118.1 hypothetical protein FD08_GL001352 [Lentilactobacillus parakefiri DSM 10551]KRM54079.1 hypothetical protein FC95_GL001784 [Lentilactobacillus kefiri DSM 20587 = JCM 5818]MCJ2160929.1 hypothetical protein [Lentilactobacillus kefiri]MCP9368856.1 hypothetical protein [Lentilactobacillus kefiri]MDH5108319.1 hypothetical protein [Lentilactobacillus kefiri]
MKRIGSVIKNTMLIAGIIVIGIMVSPRVAKAYTNLGDNLNIDYVQLKRPMFTGYYTKVNGHRGHRVITPKGTIMKVLGMSGTTVSLSYDLISYQKMQRMYKPTHPASYNTPHYNTKYFRPYKLKLPVRDVPMQSGKGYVYSKAAYYKPIFYITMDGYLQYYSNARLKHYDVKNIFESKSGSQYANPLWQIKPTASVKINHFKTVGKTSYVYYKKPVKGLVEKKVSSKYYRLSIKKGVNKTQSWGNEDSAWTVWWTTYTVGGHPFFFIREEEADN